jgi:hypothetical protein
VQGLCPVEVVDLTAGVSFPAPRGILPSERISLSLLKPYPQRWPTLIDRWSAYHPHQPPSGCWNWWSGTVIRPRAAAHSAGRSNTGFCLGDRHALRLPLVRWRSPATFFAWAIVQCRGLCVKMVRLGISCLSRFVVRDPLAARRLVTFRSPRSRGDSPSFTIGKSGFRPRSQLSLRLPYKSVGTPNVSGWPSHLEDFV